jgi:glutamyl-tRNA synthetase
MLISQFASVQIWDAASIENMFKTLAIEKNIKVGELQMIFRIMLVGSKMGPQVFSIAEIIGKEETVNRINNALKNFN